MQKESIQFLQITPAELIEAAAVRTVELLLPKIHELQKQTPETRRYNRKETAARLGITLTTLWAKTKAGKIESEAFGKRVLYTEAAIEAAMRKRNFGGQ